MSEHENKRPQRGVGSNNPAQLDTSKRQTDEDWKALGGDGLGGRVYDEANDHKRTAPQRQTRTEPLNDKTDEKGRDVGQPGYGSGGVRPSPDNGKTQEDKLSKVASPAESETRVPLDQIRDRGGAGHDNGLGLDALPRDLGDGSSACTSRTDQKHPTGAQYALPESGPSGGGERASKSDAERSAALGANKMLIEDKSGDLPSNEEVRRKLNSIDSDQDQGA